MPVPEALEHLVGLQAQEQVGPYVGLWSRLDPFDPDELGRLLVQREAVRLTLQRGTVHLVTARDALFLRPLVQPVVERVLYGAFRRRLAGTEPAEIEAATRELLADAELTARELGRALVERGVGDDVEALGNAARVHVPLVQVPPRGVWGRGGQARYRPLETWLGREPEREPSREELVLRYLRAFGPASVRDAQTWCGLTRLRDVVERLRPQLVAFRDENGVELFDLPDAPRPDEDVPAPVRFLGEYDNALLGFADRRRVIPEGFPWRELLRDGRHVSNVLVDGALRAMWRLDRDGGAATLELRASPPLRGAERDEVAAEAERLLAFLAPDAARRDVRFAR